MKLTKWFRVGIVFSLLYPFFFITLNQELNDLIRDNTDFSPIFFADIHSLILWAFGPILVGWSIWLIKD